MGSNPTPSAIAGNGKPDAGRENAENAENAVIVNPPSDITFFSTPASFRAWLRKHHKNAVELWVGFHKKRSGKPSITWPESVDAALCFGWIDGVRRGIDDESYAIRLTPRKITSTWSAVNIKRVDELTGGGLMQPGGPQGVSGANRGEVGHLRLRTAPRGGACTHRTEAFSREQGGLGVL